MLSIDIQYLTMLPLELFIQTDDNHWKFRCPVCGDSKKSPLLKRGNAQVWDGALHIKCFNCGYKSSLSYFIKVYFPGFYKDYRMDKVKWRDFATTSETKPTKEKSTTTVLKREYTKIDLPKITTLPQDHIVVKLVQQRMIPKRHHTALYYTENYAAWVNTIIPDKFKNINSTDKRLVIPIFDRFKRLIGMQGRSLETQYPKYSTIKLDATDDLIFGMDKINTTKPIYVTEGPIDSMFLDNAIATCTSISKFDLLRSIAAVENFILVYDNEKRNSDTIRYMQKALTLGFKIVIWDKDMVAKDINDMVLKLKYTKSELYDIIDANSYTGRKGIVKLKFWKRG